MKQVDLIEVILSMVMCCVVTWGVLLGYAVGRRVLGL